ncbi:hypothetical protein EB796_007729 [Bugula neritina]|uniref:Uncharacterized protein n=1 Tax=Bugula neritina TaxID=10212 RepID=A0A7J7K6Y8_BUGNE|nr:hypothetical protein EB796_007729 [Bugula neritina]
MHVLHCLQTNNTSELFVCVIWWTVSSSSISRTISSDKVKQSSICVATQSCDVLRILIYTLVCTLGHGHNNQSLVT